MMDKFYLVNASGGDSNAVIKDCLDQLDSAPKEANFGFIYVSDVISASLENILKKCKFKTGIKHWAGSLGIGLISTDTETYDEPAISILLCQFPEDEFRVIETIHNSDELAEKLLWPANSDSYFAMMHIDAYNPQSQILLDELEQSIENCFIAGGITSSRDAQLHIADEVGSDGISGVIFSDKVSVLTNLSQGCAPLGKQHIVTQNQDNIVIRLGDRPALDVLYDDIGEILSRDLDQASDYVFAGICIPGSDISDYKIRNFVGIDEGEKVFAINDHLNEGDKLMICKRDGESATRDMLAMLKNIKQRVTSPIKGGVYISCLGRGREQFGEDSEEVKMIHEVLGDFPLTGFFASGEIHNKHIYGYTGVLTLFT